MIAEKEASWVRIRGRGRKSGWREHNKKPEAKGTAQKNKEQVDGKRAALERRPFEPSLYRSEEYRQKSRHSRGGGHGPDGGRQIL